MNLHEVHEYTNQSAITYH